MTSQRARWWVTRMAAVLVTLAGTVVLLLGLQRTGAFGDGGAVVGRLPTGTAPVAVTLPGMTELAGTTVRVRAASSAMGVPVFIGVGRADDVEAYLGRVARTEITAVEESGVLRVVPRPGEASLPDPSGVDVWTASVRAGGVATLTWPRTPGSWRLVIATDGRTPPTAAEFTWSGIRGASAAPALIAVGAVLTVIGVAALAAMRSGRIFAGTGTGTGTGTRTGAGATEGRDASASWPADDSWPDDASDDGAADRADADHEKDHADDHADDHHDEDADDVADREEDGEPAVLPFRRGSGSGATR